MEYQRYAMDGNEPLVLLPDEKVRAHTLHGPRIARVASPLPQNYAECGAPAVRVGTEPGLSHLDDAEKRPEAISAAHQTKASRTRMRVKKRAFYRGMRCLTGPPGLGTLPQTDDDLPVVPLTPMADGSAGPPAPLDGDGHLVVSIPDAAPGSMQDATTMDPELLDWVTDEHPVNCLRFAEPHQPASDQQTNHHKQRKCYQNTTKMVPKWLRVGLPRRLRTKN